MTMSIPHPSDKFHTRAKPDPDARQKMIEFYHCTLEQHLLIG